MNSVMRFMVWGTIPFGGLLGGALATWIGLRETIVVGADRRRARRSSGSCSRPQRHLREMPEPIGDDCAAVGDEPRAEALPSLSA